MFVWVIQGLIAKANAADRIPEGVYPLVVADNVPGAEIALRDATEPFEDQRRLFAKAVGRAVELMGRGQPVAVICAAGQSRSVTVACTAAALFERTSFHEQWQKVRAADASIANPSPVLAVAKAAYPRLFDG